MMTLFGIIAALVIAFVILGLIGWGVQALAIVATFLEQGITGCIGCFIKFFWVIFLAIIAFYLFFC